LQSLKLDHEEHQQTQDRSRYRTSYSGRSGVKRIGPDPVGVGTNPGVDTRLTGCGMSGAHNETEDACDGLVAQQWTAVVPIAQGNVPLGKSK